MWTSAASFFPLSWVRDWAKERHVLQSAIQVPRCACTFRVLSVCIIKKSVYAIKSCNKLCLFPTFPRCAAYRWR